MRIHHLDCGTMCPYGRKLLTGEGSVFAPSELVCHCLLIETAAGLVLVDSGFGSADLAHARERLGTMFVAAMRPRLAPEVAAMERIRALGLSPADVRHIVLTHLDLDHAGGISDFPHARVHVLAREHRAAMRRATLIEKQRYRSMQWAHGPDWATYDAGGEPWFGFECVRQLEGLPPEILLVPLFGHTRGHCGVAVATDAGWLLHAGDAYFFRGEVEDEPRCPPLAAAYQRVVEVDSVARRRNQIRLRTLAREHRDDVTVFCAHDSVELARERAARAASAARAAA